ncbi:hypothetical protein OAM09_05370 [Candidatus Pelagibacter sp.]|nr:hypothetical protein [Candidatus Pelagibacter sp.]
MKKKKIYFWSCDYSNISGEGILARSYINHYEKKNPNLVFFNINRKSKFQKKNDFRKNYNLYNSVYHKYVFPIVGILRLWLLFLSSKKISYINYLPLWNFIIFILLPPGTILGPITGTVNEKKIIINFLEKLSILIIRIRYKKLVFSNNFYEKKYFKKKTSHKFNFILNDFRKINSNQSKKKYDFIIYYRNLTTSYNNYIFKIIKELILKNYKVAIIGDKIPLKKTYNFGYVSRSKAKIIISQSRCAINNPENLFSYFFQDCLSFDLKIFYNKSFTKFNIFKTKKLIPISNKEFNNDIKIILNHYRI